MSDAPGQIYAKMTAALAARRAALETSAKTDQRFHPPTVMTDPAVAVTEARAELDAGLEPEQDEMGVAIDQYRIASSLCGLGRDHLAIHADRLALAAGYLNEVCSDLDQNRLRYKIPGCESEEGAS